MHQIQNIISMKYLKNNLLFILLVCLGTMAMAQDKPDKEFQINVGDTIVWKPFDQCDNIGYSISGKKAISFTPIKYGEKIQIIAKEVGISSISATCEDFTLVAQIVVKNPIPETVVKEKIEKPLTQVFTSQYSFTPPTDNFFICYSDPENDCNETTAKVGAEEAYNDGHGTDRFWNIKTGENWYYRPESQGWTIDVSWEFDPLDTKKSFFPLNAFANEVSTDNLSQYYVGMDKVLDVDCWLFFVDKEDGNVVRYWVDPVNGCTLRRQVNNEKAREVTVYNLYYNKWYFGPSFKKSLHDTTR